jgi:tetratricopeptide (TPR) repeat protein
MRRAIASIILVSLVLAGSPAMAADEWKDLYLDARDKDLAGRRPNYQDAVKHLTRAIAEKPSSSLGERSYSLEFFNYFPNYQLGRAYMGLQRREDAIASFKEEERQGLIQKVAADYEDLKKLLKEAEDRQNQETVRTLRQQLDRSLAEAADLESRDRIDEAIAKAQEAMARARNLDGTAQARVTSVLECLRQKQTQKDTEARLQREREQLQRDLAEARRLLNAGSHRDALVKFDAILKTDPGNALARDGRIEALDKLLATTTRESRLKDLADGRRLFEAGSVEAAIPLLTEAATDPTLTEAVVLLRRAQDIASQKRQKLDGDRRIAELRREVLQLISKNNFTEASLRLNLILGLVPGDDDATKRLADIDERMARDARDLLLGDRELPALAFVAPKHAQSETQEDTITVSGVATDDRGLARITIKSGDLVARNLDLSKDQEARTHTFDESVPLVKGLNRVVVSVVDRKGRTFEAVFTVGLGVVLSGGSTASGIAFSGVVVT